MDDSASRAIGNRSAEGFDNASPGRFVKAASPRVHEQTANMRTIATASLPTLAAFAGLIPVTGSIFAYRAMIIVLALWALAARRRADRTPGSSGVLVAFKVLVVIWSACALVGAFIGGVDTAVARDLLAIGFGFAACGVVVSSPQPIIQLRWMRRGWVVALIATGMIGLREAASGAHLSNYLAGTEFAGTEFVGSQFKLIASVFGNPNAFALFLIFCLTFVLSGVMQARTRSVLLLYVSLIPFIGLLLLLSGSRLGLSAFTLMNLMALLLGNRRYLATVVTITAGALAMLLTFSTQVGVWLDEYVAGKVWTSPSEILARILSGSQGSGTDRWNIYLDGVWLIGQSGGFGFGPGSFAREMAERGVPYPTWGILSPHNLAIEAAAQYGLIVLVGVCVLGASMIRSAWRGRTLPATELRGWADSVLCGVTGVVVVSFANSSFLLVSASWVFLATCLLACTVLDGSMSGGHDRVP